MSWAPKVGKILSVKCQMSFACLILERRARSEKGLGFDGKGMDNRASGAKSGERSVLPAALHFITAYKAFIMRPSPRHPSNHPCQPKSPFTSSFGTTTIILLLYSKTVALSFRSQNDQTHLFLFASCCCSLLCFCSVFRF